MHYIHMSPFNSIAYGEFLIQQPLLWIINFCPPAIHLPSPLPDIPLSRSPTQIALGPHVATSSSFTALLCAQQERKNGFVEDSALQGIGRRGFNSSNSCMLTLTNFDIQDQIVFLFFWITHVLYVPLTSDGPCQSLRVKVDASSTVPSSTSTPS
jgi:hypothetical protein